MRNDRESAMQVIVAGRDRTAELGPYLKKQAVLMARRPEAPEQFPDNVTALSLREAASDADSLDRLFRLVWQRTGLATADFYVPRRAGIAGRLMAGLRTFLWKVLRYQHDRMAHQQTLVNTQLALTLELMHARHKQEMAELRERLRQIEKATNGK